MNNNQNKKLFISIIIPTYNADKYLDNCLSSIFKQTYNNFEVFIIDGGSNDNTLDIAKRYNTIILNNPNRDAESGKSIGIQNAKGEIIALIDADNELVQENWIERMIQPFLDDAEIWGVESPWFINPYHSLVNQYVTLLKIADPLARRFHPNLIEEEKENYIVKIARIRQTPVVGANGFLWRKDFILEINQYIPKFEEVNYASAMAGGGYYKFARLKNVGIYHHYCDTIWDFIKKRLKIGRKFLTRKTKGQKTWVDNATKFNFILAIFYNISVIGPLIEALKEYKKSKNKAWFLHPLMSFFTIMVYSYTFLEFFILKAFSIYENK